MASADTKPKFTDDELRLCFSILDTDKDGKITPEDVDSQSKNVKCSFSKKDIDEMFDRADKNRDGKLDHAEFQEALGACKLLGDAVKDIAQTVFKVFDRDGDGHLDKRDFNAGGSRVLQVLSEATSKDMFRDGDLDKDGKISFDEFKRLWEQKN